MDPFFKETIGHYKILHQIGSGGMAEVYLAQDTRLGRKVALKLLSRELTDDVYRVLRFKREARAASSLNHPNIITIYDIGEIDSFHYIATEFVDGETLRAQMSSGKIGLWDAVGVVIQIGEALTAAHEIGIIHRDIKPENIMRRSDGVVKVLDFGLAKLSDSDLSAEGAESALTLMVDTQAGVVMGTPQYMSPEQIRGYQVDYRSDIFSLGVVLYEMITAMHPFKGATANDTMAAILRMDPAPLSQLAPLVPKGLEEIVSITLRRESEERFQSTSALVSSLKSILEGREKETELTQPMRVPTEEPDPSTIARQQTRTDTDPYKYSTGAAATEMPAIKDFPVSFVRRATWLLIPGLFSLVILIWLFSTGPLSDRPAKPAPERAYSTMPASEKLEFVKQKAERVSGMLGEHPRPISDAAAASIMSYVDHYAERANSLRRSEKPGFGDGLRVVYGRASQYAPVIIKSFNEKGIPPVMGLYIPMIEAEYGTCLQAPTGPMGPFQLTSNTAVNYGINPGDRCDIVKVAPAAAQYIADLSVEFGKDSNSMTLVILSFNRSPDAVRGYLRNLQRTDPNFERSFWTLNDHRDSLDDAFKNEGTKYVPKFFAAAIVFENPEAFGMPQLPLSSIVD
jgi:serine/threonine protein kinase